MKVRILYFLILLVSVLVILTACQTKPTIAGPLPTPINRLSESNFEQAKTLFESNCQVCHVTVNTGPQFKNYLPVFTKVIGGTDYLINTVLFGLDGPITASGNSYDILMSNYPQLSDSDIALILNYGLTAWENVSLLPESFKLITSDKVAEQRKLSKTPSDVFALRNALELP